MSIWQRLRLAARVLVTGSIYSRAETRIKEQIDNYSALSTISREIHDLAAKASAEYRPPVLSTPVAYAGFFCTRCNSSECEHAHKAR